MVTGTRMATMTTLALSYDQIAAKLGIAPASARRLVHRKKWRKTKGNDGRAIIQVPADVFEGHGDGPNGDHHDNPNDEQHGSHDGGHYDGPRTAMMTDGALSTVLEQLRTAQAELVEMAHRLGAAENEAATLRADRDRWASMAQELARKPRGLWGWLRRTS